MVKSMTGFGRGVFSDEKRTVTAEIKSVNHRYSDITVKCSRRYAFAEEAVKALVKKAAPRGKIDVSLSVEALGASDSAVRLDLPLARQYHEALLQLKEGIEGLPGEADLALLSSMPDVLRSAVAEDDEEELLAAILAAVSAAAEALDEMRRVEGAKLAEDILYRNGLLKDKVREIEAYAPEVVRRYTEKMKERIAELLGSEAAVPQDRILLEAAVFADKSNITEELVRLGSHTAQLETIMASDGEPAGKRLDFLVQEMNRESNTIASKANDINITNAALVLKAEIEKIREQVQNIE